MTTFNDHVVFITGAARGQGRSHAVRLAEEGADVIAVDICGGPGNWGTTYPPATVADLHETARLVESTGRRAEIGIVDVRDFTGLSSFLTEAMDHFGRLDGVVANAGVLTRAVPADQISEEDWDLVVDVNLKGVWHTCKAAIPLLTRGGAGGAIVLISSTGGLKGTANFGAYTASKHGVVGLMRTLARELGPKSVRVNTIHPTGVPTDLFLNEDMYKLFAPHLDEPTLDDVLPLFNSMNVLPVPWVEERDVSDAVVFLLSDAARYITGNELKVDAGYLLK